MYIVGIDLAWGERKPDSLCLIQVNRGRAMVRAVCLSSGDQALLDWFREWVGDAPVFVLVDGPIVCPNATGTRPVDRLTHTLFGRHHAACHPANSTKCPRPQRIARRLQELGLALGWDLGPASRLVAEVYPHPAMVRWFHLDRIVKYKRGPVTNRRREFRRLQRLLRRCLGEIFPELELGASVEAVLSQKWSKPVEDQLDAFFCALIGYHHYLHGGRKSQVLGDCQTGFILLPTEEVEKANAGGAGNLKAACPPAFKPIRPSPASRTLGSDSGWPDRSRP